MAAPVGKRLFGWSARPRQSLLVAALLLAGFHQQSQANEPAYYDSLRLVGAMREDELMLLALRAAKALRNEPVEQDAECFDRYEYPDLTHIPATQISEKLTPAEVEDALRYFQSPSGRKFVRRNELALTGKLAGAEALSAAERTELRRFKQRPAGRKLLGDLITRQPALMAEAIPSVNQHLAHCAYLRDTQLEPQAAQKSCESGPIASLDNVCLASYAAEGDAAKPSRATIEVDCRHHGRGLRSQIDLPDPQFPVALRWSKSRELEILIDKPGVRISSAGRSNSAQRFRVASRQATDPPVLECLPVSRDHPTLAEHLPMAITVGAWRAYRRPGVCLMTARIPKEEVPGADGDTLLQFRRTKHATLPFATSRLAFVVQTYQTSNPRPLLVDAGEHRLAMIQHPQEMNHMVSGKVAESLLKNLQQNPAELRVTPEGAPSYTIPVRRQDFDFAYSDFSECLNTLKAT